MKRSLYVFGILAALVGSAQAQEKKEAVSPSELGITLPKAGPEQAIFKDDAGIWDAIVEMRMQADGEPDVSKGVETITLLDGGLWLIQDFKGKFMGMPYHGHMVNGYDSVKKKYVGTWVDSMSPGLTQMEGTYDPKTKTLTSNVEGPCPDGTNMKCKSTTEWKDANTRVFTMHSPASMGPEFAMMKITYKRRAPTTSASR